MDNNFKKQLEKAGHKAAQSRGRDAELAAALQGPCPALGPLSTSREHRPASGHRPRESPHHEPGVTDPQEASKDEGFSLALSVPASRTARRPGQDAPFVRPPAPLGLGRPRRGGAPRLAPQLGSQSLARAGPGSAEAGQGLAHAAVGQDSDA